MLGTKFKLIMGYKGSDEAQLAVERGEVEGHSTSWTAVKVGHPDWDPEKKISIVVQYALKRHPELPDVPTAVELARNDEERAILARGDERDRSRHRLYDHARRAGRPRRRAAPRLRRHMTKDPEFIADAQQAKLTLGPITGEELQKLVAEVSNLPPGLLEKVRTAYTTPRTN